MNNLYQHKGQINNLDPLTASKVICIGRNYVDHIKELGNVVPKQPVLFMKPNSALVNWEDVVAVPTNRGECHHEIELALLIGDRLQNATAEQVAKAVAGVTLALDLTLRDVQSELKGKGQPWELAKAFDASCPVANWRALPSVEWLKNANMSFAVNGEVRQQTNTDTMIWSCIDLIQFISKHFTLMPGDIVLTGTPAGVQALNPGDKIEAKLDGMFSITSEVVGCE